MKKSPFDPEILRELSARTVMFHQAVAERMGLSSADHKCLDLIERHGGEGRITPGRVAELTGLTTGAVTGVLDRLESAGFVWREKDPDDRRQIIVHVRRERMDELGNSSSPSVSPSEAIRAEYTAAGSSASWTSPASASRPPPRRPRSCGARRRRARPRRSNLATVPRGTRSTASRRPGAGSLR